MKTEQNWDAMSDRAWSIQASNQAIKAISLAGELQTIVRALAEQIRDQQSQIVRLNSVAEALAEIVLDAQ